MSWFLTRKLQTLFSIGHPSIRFSHPISQLSHLSPNFATHLPTWPLISQFKGLVAAACHSFYLFCLFHTSIITYIQCIHSYPFLFIHCLFRSEEKTSLGCRVEIWTRACTTNGATLHLASSNLAIRLPGSAIHAYRQIIHHPPQSHSSRNLARPPISQTYASFSHLSHLSSILATHLSNLATHLCHLTLPPHLGNLAPT
jgi:hypothetical protein